MAYSSSIRSSYNLSAASSTSVFVFVVLLLVWAAEVDDGISESVMGLGVMLEFDGFSVVVAVGILAKSLRSWFVLEGSDSCFWMKKESSLSSF